LRSPGTVAGLSLPPRHGKARTPALQRSRGTVPDLQFNVDATAPRLPEGFKTVVDKDGSRH
jgi:hypothetical protein